MTSNPTANQHGFTLVEVLVAALVLFSAVAIGTLAFRSAVHSLRKVSSNAIMADYLADIVLCVKSDMQDGRLSGKKQYGKRVSYRFKAEKMRSERTKVIEEGTLISGKVYGRFRIFLCRVHLEIRFDDNGNIQKNVYDYKELIWSES